MAGKKTSPAKPGKTTSPAKPGSSSSSGIVGGVGDSEADSDLLNTPVKTGSTGSINRNSAAASITMPGSGEKGYSYKSSGTNSQGNHYCARDYGASAPNPNTYHYSNTNGSYYYSNPNGSTYYNNGKGEATYTPPSKK